MYVGAIINIEINKQGHCSAHFSDIGVGGAHGVPNQYHVVCAIDGFMRFCCGHFVQWLRLSIGQARGGFTRRRHQQACRTQNAEQIKR